MDNDILLTLCFVYGHSCKNNATVCLMLTVQQLDNSHQSAKGKGL